MIDDGIKTKFTNFYGCHIDLRGEVETWKDREVTGENLCGVIVLSDKTFKIGWDGSVEIVPTPGQVKS